MSTRPYHCEFQNFSLTNNGEMDLDPDGDDVAFIYGFGFLSNIYLR
jgi:hypothetical protein